MVFVDDDDRIEGDYIRSLLNATGYGEDIITFKVMVSINGEKPMPCRYSMHFERDDNTPYEYQRLPNHICAVKRSLALATPYPPVFCGEDKQYGLDLHPKLTSEHAIDRVLYHYDFNVATTETQVAKRTLMQSPTVDVVILSKSPTEEMQKMTQYAVNTCRAGASGHLVNIIVLEQHPGVTYRNATTEYIEDEFAYNTFANIGAASGTAPWIMIANNDLVFEDDWLAPLLEANHPVVSPINPGDSRQRGINRTEHGYVNGRHFSGWCFMITRDVWDKIGGFDEDFRFWCADDSVVEQLRAINVPPMLVGRSRVRHLVSKTLGSEPARDELTWAQVWTFEQKYGVEKFAGDQRYADWKARNGK